MGEDIRRLILKIYSAFLSADGRVSTIKGLTLAWPLFTVWMLFNSLRQCLLCWITVLSWIFLLEQVAITCLVLRSAICNNCGYLQIVDEFLLLFNIVFEQRVNYQGIAGSDEFQVYTELTKQLVRLQVENSTREEKLAFFINIYNALVIHANVVRGPPVNLWQRYKVTHHQMAQ